MNWVTGLFIYVMIWWVTIFMVLPWGVRTAQNPESGHATSAPLRALIGRKFLANSALAGVLWLILYVLIDQEIITLDQIIS